MKQCLRNQHAVERISMRWRQAMHIQCGFLLQGKRSNSVALSLNGNELFRGLWKGQSTE